MYDHSILEIKIYLNQSLVKSGANFRLLNYRLAYVNNNYGCDQCKSEMDFDTSRVHVHVCQQPKRNK